MNLQKKNRCRRSPFFYVGDKFKLLAQLKEQFPSDIDRFIEPFCGGGSVFLNTQAQEYLLNDLDAYLIRLHRYLMKSAADPDAFWKTIQKNIEKYDLTATFLGRDVPPGYREQYKKTYFAVCNKEAYRRMRSDFNVKKDDMALLYLLLIYGFNRMLRFNAKGDFNLPVGNVDFNKNVAQALEFYFSYVADRQISFYNQDFESFLEKVQPTPADFVYLDPPYLITSSEYNKLWNEENEKRLLKCLDELDRRKVRFAVSNVLKHRDRTNEIFSQWAQKYTILPIQSNYINYHDNTKKDSQEVLVKNY